MNRIQISAEPYLAAWLQTHFGNPVQLIKDSPESRLLKRFLEKKPDQKIIPNDGNVEIQIPWFKEKDPRVYNYLSKSAKKAIEESFETLFINNLWSEVGSIGNFNCSLTTVIRAWCDKHGLIEPTDHITDIQQLKAVEERNAKNLETVRQKYYRLRKKYFTETGIKLS